MMNCMQILVWTFHCAIHLSVTNSDRFLHLGSPIPVKIRTWRIASNSHLSEWKLILFPCIPGLLVSGDWPCTVWYKFSCISVISQLDCHFLRPLFAVKPKYFWNNDLPHCTHGFFNEHLLCVLWRKASTREVFTAVSSHSNVHGWLRTARTWGLADVLPDK